MLYRAHAHGPARAAVRYAFRVPSCLTANAACASRDPWMTTMRLEKPVWRDDVHA